MSDTLPRHWKELDSSHTATKLDDLGDALLHALDEILCGSSNCRPVNPACTQVSALYCSSSSSSNEQPYPYTLSLQ